MDKVCGDFLGADTIARVRALGVDLEALGAAPIRRVRLIRGDRVAEATLPFLAMSLSRRVLDAALLRQAAQAGAAVRTGCLVRQVTPGAGRWTVRLAGQPEITAATVFLATGKHDVRDLPRPGTADGAVGMKMYFALRPAAAPALEGNTELALFAGGYAGLQPVEAGQAVLCVAVQRRAFQRAGGGWPGLLALIAEAAPCWADVLGGATPLLSRPLAVAGIPYGMLAGSGPSDGAFRLGDQAAVIPSLTGDGMAIALHSGIRAAQVWMSGGDAMAYQQGLARDLGSQMRLARLLHHVCMTGRAQPAVVLGAAWFPGLLRRAARGTRIAGSGGGGFDERASGDGPVAGMGR
jgi:flavin-dependent dehydrogenase